MLIEHEDRPGSRFGDDRLSPICREGRDGGCIAMEVITNILMLILFLSVAWLLERLCLVASRGVSAIKSCLDNFDQRLAAGVWNIGPLLHGNKAWEVQIGNSVLQLWYRKIPPKACEGWYLGGCMYGGVFPSSN
jgi:hypothetical protein